MSMKTTDLEKLVKEFVEDKNLIHLKKTESFSRKFKVAIQYFEEDIVGDKIDYVSDLVVRELLKDYVFYDFYNMLPEFKERYENELTKLQFKSNATVLS